jgi:LacI family transcriptional regulator
MHDRSVNGLIQTDIPIVYTYCSTSQQEDIQIRYDNYKISCQVVGELLRQYGDTVGIIDGPIQSAPARQRIAGVEEAYRKAGVPMNLKLRSVGNWEYEGGKTACREILDSGCPVKAIYAINDLMALGAIREIRDRGMQVPGEIAVVGFDDIPFAEYADPSLTTVHVPLDEMGYESAAALADLLEKGKSRQKELCLPCRMIWRQSCPKPSAQGEMT